MDNCFVNLNMHIYIVDPFILFFDWPSKQTCLTPQMISVQRIRSPSFSSSSSFILLSVSHPSLEFDEAGIFNVTDSLRQYPDQMERVSAGYVGARYKGLFI